MARVDLHAVTSKSEFISKVEHAVHDIEDEHWVLGGGWNNDNWGGELPEASWIDNITHNHPVWLSRMDGHMGLANSVALNKIGIHNLIDAPVGGTIIKNINGAPTGLLVDAAMQLLLPHIPKATIQERRDALIRASKLGLSRGVTAVVDFGDISLEHQLVTSGKISLRCINGRMKLVICSLESLCFFLWKLGPLW